jgi:hypothetical protein
MRLLLRAVGTLVLWGLSVAVADNQPPQPVPPQPIPPQPVPLQPAPDQPALIQPNLPMVMIPGNPAMIPRLEEEVETLEAQRDTKKAYVRAAEVGVRASEVGLERMLRLVTNGAASKEELEKYKLEIEAAKALVEIRIAEMKEVEVKIKHAKKRLEEAKAGPRPLHAFPPNPPRPVEVPKLEAPPKPKDPPKQADPTKPIA